MSEPTITLKFTSPDVALNQAGAEHLRNHLDAWLNSLKQVRELQNGDKVSVCGTKYVVTTYQAGEKLIARLVIDNGERAIPDVGNHEFITPEFM